MTVQLTHSFVTSQAQSANSNLVSRSAWNEAHVFRMSGPAVLARLTATSGDVAEAPAVSGTGYVLREAGGEIAWGTIGVSALPSVTFPTTSMQLSASPLLVGRYSAGSGEAQEVGLSGFDFAGSLLRIQAKAVSYDRIQDLTSSGLLLGRYTAGSGSLQEVGLSGFNFAGSLLRIQAKAVSYDRIQDLSGSNIVLGRFTAGSGVVQELALSGLDLSGSTLRRIAYAGGDVVANAGSGVLSISTKAVTYAKMQDISASQLVLGRNVAGSGAISEITLHNVLDWLGTTVGQLLYKASATQWAVLSPGASGQVLASQSVGVAPKYVSIATQFPSSTASFMAHKNGTDQTGISSSIYTKLTFSSELYDIGGYFAANGWTPPAGKVKMEAGFYVNQGVLAVGSPVAVGLYKDGVILRRGIWTSQQNAGSALVAIEDDANGSNVYEVYAYIQSTAGTTNVVWGDSSGTYFMGSME